MTDGQLDRVEATYAEIGSLEQEVAAAAAQGARFAARQSACRRVPEELGLSIGGSNIAYRNERVGGPEWSGPSEEV